MKFINFIKKILNRKRNLDLSKEKPKVVKKVKNIYTDDSDDDPNEKKYISTIENKPVLLKKDVAKKDKKNKTSKIISTYTKILEKIDKKELDKNDNKEKNIDIKSIKENQDIIKNNIREKKQISQKKNIITKKNLNYDKKDKKKEKNHISIVKKKDINNIETEFRKYLIKLVKDDKEKLNEITLKIKKIKHLEERIINEKELEKRNKDIELLYKLVQELKEKYYYLFMNDNKERYSFNQIDIHKLLIEKNNTILKENILKITNEIKELDKEINRLKDEKIKEVKKVKKVEKNKLYVNLSKYENIDIFMDNVLYYQNEIYKKIKKDLGKITFEKYTSLKKCIDYNKLLASTMMLSVAPGFLRLGKTGLILGSLMTTKSISNLRKFIYYKEIEHQTATFKNYSDKINSGILNIDSAINSVTSGLKDLDDIEIYIEKYYKNENGYDEIISKINFLKKDLGIKEKDLKKEKEIFNEAQKINEKTIQRARKSRY